MRCLKSSSGKHRFSGYPIPSCSWCGMSKATLNKWQQALNVRCRLDAEEKVLEREMASGA